MNKVLITIIIFYSLIFLGINSYANNIENNFYNDIGATSNRVLLKSVGGFLIPTNSDTAIGSSTVNAVFKTATSTEFCLSGDTCITSWSAVSGTVTSVDLSVPTGLTISGNPITTSGTLALGLDTGYQMLTDIASSTWDNKLSSILAKGNFIVGNDAGIAQATSTMFISSTGNVGIGTTSPSYKLDVNGFTNTKSIHEVSPEGLVLGMNFNTETITGTAGSETVLDSSEYNNHGTNSGATATSTAGFNGGGAFSFDGSNDYIYIDYIITETQAESTFSAWIYPNSTGSTIGNIVKAKDGTNYYISFMLRGSSNTGLQFYVNNNSSKSVNVAVSPDMDSWNHLTFTFDANYLKVYKNGIFITQSDNTIGLMKTNPDGLFLGADLRTGSPLSPFNGLIDSPQIYNRALSADEIKALYLQRAEVKDSYVNQKDVFVDSSGNVGIGTVSPSGKLQVTSSAVANKILDSLVSTILEAPESRLQLISDNGGNYASSLLLSNAEGAGDQRTWALLNRGTSGNNSFQIGYRQSATSEDIPNVSLKHFTILTTGQVGIGEESPLGSLHLESTNKGLVSGNLQTGADPILILEGEDPSVELFGTNNGSLLGGYEISEIDGSGGINFKWGMLSQTTDAGKDLRFNYGTGADAYVSTNILTLQETGNVGIGTTGPAYKLDVNGTGRFTGALTTGEITSKAQTFTPQTTAPTGTDGKAYFDDNDKSFKVYNPQTASYIDLIPNLPIQPTDCPDGYIPVPGNALYGTAGGFCVMKYEAKCASSSAPTVGLTAPDTGYQTYSNSTQTCTSGNSLQVASLSDGYPIANISQTNAIAYCEGLGTGYHLITNNEWMTIARNIEQQTANWTGGTVGSGGLWRGHTDNSPATALPANSDDGQGYEGTGNSDPSIEKRTFTLSNGETIWDLSGNVWEWNSDTIKAYKAPIDSTPISEWIEFTAITNYQMMSYANTRPSNPNWNSTQNMGRLYTDYDDGSAARAFRRGGDWTYTSKAGVFALRLNGSPADTGYSIGFRCVREF